MEILKRKISDTVYQMRITTSYLNSNHKSFLTELKSLRDNLNETIVLMEKDKNILEDDFYYDIYAVFIMESIKATSIINEYGSIGFIPYIYEDLCLN